MVHLRLAVSVVTALVAAVPPAAVFLQVGGDEPTETGASAMEQALTAASNQELARVENGVQRDQNLQEQNAELRRQSRELEQRVASKNARAALAEEHSPELRRVRALEQEVKDLKAKSMSAEADQRALLQTVQRLMNTSETQALRRSIAQAETAKLATERDCAREQQQLGAELQNATAGANSSVRLAEALQQQNAEMRRVAQALSEQKDDLERNASGIRGQKERLEVSLESSLSAHAPDAKAKEALAEEHRNAALLDKRSQLLQLLREEQERAEKLEAGLRKVQTANSQFQQELQHSIKLAKENDDGSAEIVQSLQEENSDLRRASGGSQGKLQTLRTRVQNLEFDKENLVKTLQSSMVQGATMKNGLKRKLFEEDQAIEERDRELVRLAKAAAAPQPKAQQRAANHTAATVVTAVATTATTTTAVATTSRAAAKADDDFIHSMAKRAVMTHYQLEAAEQQANEAISAASATAVEATTTSTTTTQAPDHLAGYLVADSEAAAAASPVDALDPEAVTKAQSEAAQEAHEDGGDGVAELLKRAESAVASL